MNNKKISFFLATSGHSGVDRAMRNLLPALVERGYNVDLIRVQGHGPQLAGPLKGITIFETSSSHVYGSFYFLLKYLKRNKPKALFADKDRLNRTALLAALCARSSTRVVVSLGTTVSMNLAERSFLERLIQKFSIAYLYPFAYKFIVNSHGVAQDIQNYLRKNIGNLEVVPRPLVSKEMIERKEPLPNHQWFLSKHAPIILGVGELSYRKDFATLIRAFAQVRKHKDCRLVILGEGKRRAALEQLSYQLGIRTHIDFLGYISDPYPYIFHADLLALSSLWEGLPVVLVEALALGTPVVSTACPSGPQEVLQNGKYGKLVPVGNHEKLAQAIVDTLKNPFPSSFLQQAIIPYTVENSTAAYLKAMGVPEIS